MAQTGERYRKLPGRRRGFLMGASVWMGSDHLLLVKSSRFREEYKRFYLRDIQAIVMANAPRFHFSTRAALIAIVWFVLTAVVSGDDLFSNRKATWIMWAAAAFLLGIWVYISAMASCRCKVYTAVSSEDLPSLYRRWTARRFLAEVEPYIAQAQGRIEGNWAEAVEERQVGPLAEGRVGLATPVMAGMPGLAPSPPPVTQSRTSVSLLFVASLCLGGLADLLTLRVAPNAARWILLSFILLQVGTAVAVLVQNYQGLLRSSLRNLAIITLVAIGVWYYAVQMAVGMSVAFQNAMNRVNNPMAMQGQMQALALINYPMSRATAGVMSLILGLIGTVLLLRGNQSNEPASFNV